jgi:hypothetical protein
MGVVKNILFILGLIFGIVGLIGMAFSYFNGITENTVFYIFSLIASIIFSWSYIILEYISKGYFKRKGEKNNG